jgi:hypothetical protein
MMEVTDLQDGILDDCVQDAEFARSQDVVGSARVTSSKHQPRKSFQGPAPLVTATYRAGPALPVRSRAMPPWSGPRD